MKKLFLILVLLVNYSIVNAQDDAIDATFIADNVFSTGIRKNVVDSQGRVYIINTISSPYVKRLKADGTVDPAFNLGNFTNINTINDILIQPDGKILIGGDFLYSGRKNLIRVDQFGNLDSNFNPQPVLVIYSIAIQLTSSGNKILVGGDNAVNSNLRLQRLDYLTGAIDTSFNIGSGPNSGIRDIETLPTGEIYISGHFSTFNGSSRKFIARLTANGSLYTFFNVGGLGGSHIEKIKILQNGQDILLGGMFTHSSGLSHILKMSISGNIDNSFNPILQSTIDERIIDIDVQSNGKILIGGIFTSVDGIARNAFARLLSNGDLDLCFTPQINDGEYAEINSITVGEDDSIYICDIYMYTGVSVNNIVKIKGTTSITAVDDTGIDINGTTGGISVPNVLAGATPDTVNGINATTSLVTLSQISVVPAQSGITLNTTTGAVNVAAGTPAGNYTLTYKICTTGSTCYCDEATVTIPVTNTPSVLIADDDSVIAPFDWDATISNVLNNDTVNGLPANETNVTIEFDPPLPAGFSHIEGSIYKDLSVQMGIYHFPYKICDINDLNNCSTAILHVAVTTPWDIYNEGSQQRTNNTVKVTGIQTGEKIIIAGDFTQCDNSAANKIARLDEWLERDSGFNTIGPSPSTSIITDLKIVNNNIYVTGNFTGFSGGTTSKGIAYLGSNGALGTFNSGGAGVAGGNAIINCIDHNNVSTPYSIIGGDFASYNGIASKNIAKLNSNGTINTSFVTGTGFNGPVYDVLIQPNGYILVAGAFTSYKGITVNKITRLLPNGNIDPNFNPGGLGISGSYVEDIVLIPTSGYIIISGNFTAYNGQARRNIALLTSNGANSSNFNPGSGFNAVVRSISYQHPNPTFNNPYTASRIYVGGDFTSYNGTVVGKLVALNIDGTINTDFIPDTFGPSTSQIHSISMQNDNFKIIVGGRFSTFWNLPNSNVTRIFYASVNYSRDLPSEELDIIDLPHNISTSVSIYPNPSEAIFNLEMKGYEGQDFELVIYNALGQLVHEINVKAENAYRLDLSNFQAGNYFVRLQNNSTTINKIITKK